MTLFLSFSQPDSFMTRQHPSSLLDSFLLDDMVDLFPSDPLVQSSPFLLGCGDHPFLSFLNNELNQLPACHSANSTRHGERCNYFTERFGKCGRRSQQEGSKNEKPSNSTAAATADESLSTPTPSAVGTEPAKESKATYSFPTPSLAYPCFATSDLYRVNVLDTDNAYTIVVDLPNVQVNDIEVQIVNEESLVVKVKKYGPWERTFPLSAAIDTAAISSRFQDNLLTIQVPKRIALATVQDVAEKASANKSSEEQIGMKVDYGSENEDEDVEDIFIF